MHQLCSVSLAQALSMTCFRFSYPQCMGMVMSKCPVQEHINVMNNHKLCCRTPARMATHDCLNGKH